MTEKKQDKKLGGTSFKNSKQKKKLQAQKNIELQKMRSKDSDLKVKIKNLQKELERISKLDPAEQNSKKIQSERKVIEEKLQKLQEKNDKLKK